MVYYLWIRHASGSPYNVERSGLTFEELVREFQKFLALGVEPDDIVVKVSRD